ncbi:C39 family peptidase [Prosthecobacter dejongeii]|uniref:Peptidase C39-like domain-containing protein n=1 Tax=Prosthecobacter dejongeii TaxID=48465 RepID=A0A7W7YL22_9BACT|nr:hypothetical protein [Prosthecobacter dejongeii]
MTNVPIRALDALASENIWQITTDQFQQHFEKIGLQWLSEKRDQARFFGPGLSLWQGQLKVTEAIVNFSSEGQPNRISLSIFNRGDSDSEFVNREKFEALVESHRTKIGQILAVSSTERGKDKTSAVAAEGYVWVKPPTAYLLEYSFQREVKSRDLPFRPEFIRLLMAPVPKTGTTPGGGAVAAKASSVTKDSLATNLKREENGDVVIANVPMVDQGPKGYCAVATAERVFKYYGIPVDQHEMAQVADSSSDGGTSPAKMYEALNKLEGRLRVRVRVIENWDYKTFMDMVGDYNKEAKRADKREVSAAPRGGTIYIDEIYGAMDGEVLKTSRIGRDRSGFGKFQRSITGLVDQGIPVMWGVMLGLLPEPEIPQASGGHMRLIIGYNLKTNEFLYTDSWGAEHALKRMPIANAYTMTTGIYYMEPMK